MTTSAEHRAAGTGVRNDAAPQVLVTGATGFIGRALVRRLLQTRVPIRLFARRAPSAAVQQDPLVETMLGDLGDATAVERAMAGIAVVYHVGAAMAGSDADYERATVTGTRNIVDACLRHDVARLVYMSSLSVVDADVTHVDEEAPLERDASARGAYSRSKAQAEKLVGDAVRTRRLPAVILRPGGVVSAEKPLLTPAVAQQVGPWLVVIGGGHVPLGLVHVEDVVDAMIAASTAPVASGSIIQLVDDVRITQNDVIAHYRAQGLRRRVVHVPAGLMMGLAWMVDVTCRLIGRTAPISPRRIRAATMARSYDGRRAAECLGWTPRTGARAAFVAPLMEPEDSESEALTADLEKQATS